MFSYNHVTGVRLFHARPFCWAPVQCSKQSGYGGWDRYLCEGSQLCVHEGKEFSFGELSVVSILPAVLLENSNQGLNASLSLCRHFCFKLRSEVRLRLWLTVAGTGVIILIS